ncbi:MAG: leucine-rich repeat protein [Methanomassiliicoccaceae archaeon]|jgi:uncharacterized repeat protein (TIGR02543 family)|nr:leucine-rich repeat protein [Methanomassiliicoccaceae archaeon]
MAEGSDAPKRKKRDPILIIGAIVLTMALTTVMSGHAYAQHQQAEGIEHGDSYKVDYVGSFYGWYDGYNEDTDAFDGDKGTVFDTSLWSVASSHGNDVEDHDFAYDFTKRDESWYVPYNMTVGSGQTLTAFENAVIGKRPGEPVYIKIENGYGAVPENSLRTWSTAMSGWDLTEKMTGSVFRSTFDITATTITNYTGLEHPYGWKCNAVVGNDGYVYVTHLIEMGETYDAVNGGMSTIVSANTHPTKFDLKIEFDKEYYESGKLIQFKHNGEKYYVTDVEVDAVTEEQVRFTSKDTNEIVGMTLYFKITVVSYVPNHRSVTVINGTGSGDHAVGSGVTITADRSPDGMVFDRWIVNSGGVTLANPNNATTTFTMPANAVSVTATYRDIIYTVTYVTTAGSGTAPTETDRTAGAAFDTKPNTFVNPGYSFAGWNTRSDGDGISYAAGETIEMPASNLVLYAIWKHEPAVHDGSTLTNYPSDRSDTSYEIPFGITKIGDGAFKDAENLTSVTIPSSVKEIGADAFKGCTNLTVIAMPYDVNVHPDAIPEDVIIIRYMTSSGTTALGGATLGSVADLMSVTAAENGSRIELTIVPPIGKKVTGITAMAAGIPLSIIGSGNLWSFDSYALGTDNKEVDLTIVLASEDGSGSDNDRSKIFGIDPLILMMIVAIAIIGIGAGAFLILNKRRP